MTWRPLSKRQSPEAAASYDALYEGIPEWLQPSLSTWIRETAMAVAIALGSPDLFTLDEFVLLVERTLRIGLDWAPKRPRQDRGEAALEDLQRLAFDDDETGLDLIDLTLRLLKDFEVPRAEAYAQQLDVFLAQGGSVWRVGCDLHGLERRVADEVALRAHEVMSPKTRAAEHLREAWSATYGRHPNPGHAYGEAVKAVEAAAIRVVCPNDLVATLGKIIGELRAKVDSWTTSLTPGGQNGIDRAVGMLELLWKAQLDRHGTPDPTAPFAASQEEAEAAVHLALTLVHWFETGAIRRNTN
jgi:hypothetical protein